MLSRNSRLSMNGRPFVAQVFISVREDRNRRMSRGNEASDLGCPSIDFQRVLFKYRADVCQQRLEAAEVDDFGMFGDHLFSEELLAIKVFSPSFIPSVAASKKSSILDVVFPAIKGVGTA